MPCMDYSDREIADQSSSRAALAEARLCQALAFIEDIGYYSDFLTNFNEKEAGCTSLDLQKWWARHKEADSKRKKREEREKEEASLRKKALSKLTKRERKLLNLEKP